MYFTSSLFGPHCQEIKGPSAENIPAVSHMKRVCSPSCDVTSCVKDHREQRDASMKWIGGRERESEREIEGAVLKWSGIKGLTRGMALSHKEIILPLANWTHSCTHTQTRVGLGWGLGFHVQAYKHTKLDTFSNTRPISIPHLFAKDRGSVLARCHRSAVFVVLAVLGNWDLGVLQYTNTHTHTLRLRYVGLTVTVQECLVCLLLCVFTSISVRTVSSAVHQQQMFFTPCSACVSGFRNSRLVSCVPLQWTQTVQPQWEGNILSLLPHTRRLFSSLSFSSLSLCRSPFLSLASRVLSSYTHTHTHTHSWRQQATPK